MSDLTTFRDHCRRMGGRITQKNIHLSDDERALFRALAKEVDVYLATDQPAEPAPDDEPMWETA